MHAALVQRPGSCIRRLAGDRARQMRFTRFLRNASVTTAEMSAQAAARTAGCVAGREVVAIQDTTELMLGGRGTRANGFGPVGRGGATGGLLLHPVLAVEAETGALLGLVDAKVWNRDGGKAAARRGRATAAKESRRWLDGAARAGEVLAAASSITVVADRESDIYEQFVRRPANVHLIIRAAQDRGGGGPAAAVVRLRRCLAGTGPAGADDPDGARARAAELAVRFSPVLLRKPRHGAAGDLPDKVRLTLVDVREASRPAEGEPIHWRLLTTHAVESLGAARRVLDLYRRRWIIEEFFRTLKTAGFDIEAAEIADPRAMSNFVAAATVAAVTVMQLVQARDGTTAQRLQDAFDPADQPILEALSARLEGKTDRQKNPHAKHSLAFAAWIIGRLGGWDGYYGKPGPRVISRGLHDFQRIKYGSALILENV